MKIVINEKEMLAMANYTDAIIGAGNVVGMAVNPGKFQCAPRDAVKKLEQWLNEKLGSKVMDTKIVTISIVPVIKNVVISIDPEFTHDFMVLYCELITAVTPIVINLVESFVKAQAVVVEDFTPKFEEFTKKWK